MALQLVSISYHKTVVESFVVVNHVGISDRRVAVVSQNGKYAALEEGINKETFFMHETWVATQEEVQKLVDEILQKN